MWDLGDIPHQNPHDGTNFTVTVQFDGAGSGAGEVAEELELGGVVDGVGLGEVPGAVGVADAVEVGGAVVADELGAGVDPPSDGTGCVAVGSARRPSCSVGAPAPASRERKAAKSVVEVEVSAIVIVPDCIAGATFNEIEFVAAVVFTDASLVPIAGALATFIVASFHVELATRLAETTPDKW